MNKKITLLNQVTGPLFIDIANEYAKVYDEVVLVTGVIEPTYASLCDKIKIVYKTTYKRKKSYLRILTWLLFYTQTYFYFLFKKKEYGEEVLIVTNPPILPFLGSAFFPKRKIRFKVLVYDVYPDVLSSFGYIKKTSLIYKYWDRMSKKSYKNAEEIFTISSVMKKVVSRNVELNKINVIYPWVDTSFIKPIKKEHNWFIKKYNLSKKKIVLYSGNMGATHDLITPLKVAKEFHKTDEDFHFLFIGNGVQKKLMMQYAAKEKLRNVTFLPYQDSEVLPYSFASADFGIVSLAEGAECLSVPSKTFYFLAAGAVIIAISEKGSEIEKIVSNNDCGIVIASGDVVKMSNFLKTTTSKTLRIKKENSRALSEMFTMKNAQKFIK